jgi:Na+-translocating ferredoxin:NAD+ oxidoreductase subunit B
MKINTAECIGCGQCLDECPVYAIKMIITSGYARAEIIEEMCIDCGACKKICPGECIE